MAERSGLRWNEFASVRPDMAAEGRRLLYQFGVGLGFLATVARDGSPRVHPMCPTFAGDGLYALIEPGPKRGDLERDGRYALHCFPPAANEDAFYVTGRAVAVTDPSVDGELRQVFASERGMAELPPEAARTRPFELLIERCLVTRAARGDWHPQHTVWRAVETVD